MISNSSQNAMNMLIWESIVGEYRTFSNNSTKYRKASEYVQYNKIQKS